MLGIVLRGLLNSVEGGVWSVELRTSSLRARSAICHSKIGRRTFSCVSHVLGDRGRLPLQVKSFVIAGSFRNLFCENRAA